MKILNITFFLLIAFFSFPVNAETNIKNIDTKTLKETFISGTPSNIELVNVEIIKQKLKDINTNIAYVNFEIRGVSSYYTLFETKWEIPVLTPVDSSETFIIKTKVKSFLKDQKWHPTSFLILNKDDTNNFVSSIKDLALWPENSIIKNTEAYNKLLKQIKNAEKKDFIYLPERLEGISICRKNKWDISITWKPDTSMKRLMFLTMTLIEKNTKKELKVDGAGYYTKNFDLEFEFPNSWTLDSAFMKHQWPRIAKLQKTEDGWVGETIIPDINVCEILLHSEKK